MMLIFSKLGRYLYSQTLRGLLLALGIVLLLIVLVDFVEEARTVGARAEAGVMTLASLTLMKTPMLVETTLPFVILFGVMYALFRLNRRSELIVMRASGLSAWRFLTPPLVLAILAGVLSPLALNPVSAELNGQFEQRRTELVSGESQTRVLSEGRIWLLGETSGRKTLIRAASANQDRDELLKVTFFFYEPDSEGRMTFIERIDAETATLRGGFWQLENAVESAPGGQPRNLEAVSFPSNIDSETVFDRGKQAKSLSFWRLRDAIRSSEKSGVSSRPYELRFFALMATPLMLAAMAMIGAAVSLRLARLGGALPLTILGGAGGFLLFFTDDLLTAVAESGNLPPPLAAIAAPLAALLLATAFIAQMEDG